MQKKFQSFGSYLEFSRKQFLLLNQNFGENIQKYQKISLVYGNESADLDSCLGSSTLAFYYNILKNQENQVEKQQKLFVPVINCCQRDIETKFEFISLLEKYQISLESLVYKDSFDLDCFINKIKQQQFDGFELILYDHNKPDTNLMKFKNYVKQIIDHHADETDQIYEKGSFGYSVIAIEPKFFLELQDFEQKIQDFIQENSLKALFLLFVYPQQQNKTVFERQFIFICEDQDVKQKVQNTLVQNMKYEFRNYDEKFEKFAKHYFALYDVTSTFSRKLLEPIVRDIKF
ncbi:hypothetical protein PPERSA_03177 [Pseudocohnilembus persalinus]|uniref:Uncharacterized protein n=1 Tax=Pseudocohnilembus persalinus TaxID=266149 RepID=A0A0V0QE12_PSEPJ|nr:hypothetical protein PPERSA_03177 [Pseudocohnilembus persalinus]|eukprot:KRX00444.1 hypothetical protein PPERSA_03177 [Pseudocohnilembus persalinus]